MATTSLENKESGASSTNNPARRKTIHPEGEANHQKRWELKPTQFHKLVDIPPKISVGESTISVDADRNEGGTKG